MRAASRATRRQPRRPVMLAAWLVVASLTACHASNSIERERARLSIRRDASRFIVASATDSTVTFRPSEVRWLKKGMRGYVVDPLQRDALIARLTIQNIDTGGTVAVIDGGVSPVILTHVVLVERPSVTWWHDKRFWFGAGAGALTGIVAASASK